MSLEKMRNRNIFISTRSNTYTTPKPTKPNKLQFKCHVHVLRHQAKYMHSFNYINNRYTYLKLENSRSNHLTKRKKKKSYF